MATPQTKMTSENLDVQPQGSENLLEALCRTLDEYFQEHGSTPMQTIKPTESPSGMLRLKVGFIPAPRKPKILDDNEDGE